VSELSGPALGLHSQLDFELVGLAVRVGDLATSVLVRPGPTGDRNTGCRLRVPGERAQARVNRDHAPNRDLTRLESRCIAGRGHGLQVVRGLILDELAAREGGPERLARKLGPDVRVDA
jgi:hypothetical protein